jgi:hypothetical protein
MRSFWLALASISGFFVACSSEPLDDDPAGDAPECEAPEFEPSLADPQYVGSVSATVLGLDGEPLPSDPLVQVCGLDICINAETASDGSVSVGVDQDIKLPAIKYGDGLTSGKLALLLPSNTDEVEAGTLRAPVLPTSGDPIAAGATASSNGIDLIVEDGAVVDFDTLVYQSDDEQAFRAAPVLAKDVPPGFDQGYGFDLYVALAPLETEICPPAGLVVPNAAELDAGAEVEFIIQGLEADEHFAPYAGFAKVADGHVSEDGETIAIESGGLPALSLVAIREKQ